MPAFTPDGRFHYADHYGNKAPFGILFFQPICTFYPYVTEEYGAVLKFVFYLFLGRSAMIGASLFFAGLYHDIPFVSSMVIVRCLGFGLGLVLVSSALSVRTSLRPALPILFCKETKKQQN